MRIALAIALLVSAPLAAHAQSADASATAMVRSDDWRVTLTVFRSPGTGLQISRGHLAAYVAHYPTVIRRDGAQRNTNFLRVGMAYYVTPSAATSPYVSLAVAPSLTEGWSTSVIADVGMRHYFGDRYSGQLGVAVLNAPSAHATRVNPTIGMGVRF
jgi:hypothetical protein